MRPRVDRELARRQLAEISKNLAEVLGFWNDRSIDSEYGGFITHLDAAGKRTGSDKVLLMQARQVWSFSAAHNHGSRTRNHLAAAIQGVDFLRSKMLDADHGGYFYRCKRDGKPVEDRKTSYVHSFVIYGLAEHYLASGEKRSLRGAEQVFDLLETKAHDAENGGYFEQFNRDWTSSEKGPRKKTLDTHMHLMEALTVLYRASGKAEHRERLVELIDILTEKMIDPREGFGHVAFSPDWKVLPPVKDRGTSYGHNVELAWLLVDAWRALGENPAEHLEVLRGLVDHALEHGWDLKHGGFYRWGNLSGEPSEKIKVWWQQSECLIGLVMMYRLTGEKRYWDYFALTHRWCMDRQRDPANGEWYSVMTVEGEPRSPHKGGAWKSAYHVSRALMRTESHLRALLGEKCPAGGWAPGGAEPGDRGPGEPAREGP